MRILTRWEWKILYKRWRVAYAHLPSAARGRIVRGCRSKALYESEAEARQLADTLPPREGVTISVYPCDICKFWHIGNTRQTPGRPNRLEL